MAKPTRHYGKWRIRWTDHAGKRKSTVCSSFKEALYQQRLKEIEAEQISKGLMNSIEENKTFNNICDYWLANKAPLKRSFESDRSIIMQHLRPAFGKILLKNFNIACVDQYKVSRLNTHKKTLHNQLTLLISMLNVAKDLKWISHVPKIKKPTIHICETNFRYLKTNEEIRRFLH